MSDVKPVSDDVPSAEEAVMPLMGHLKELRTRLIRASIALVITTGVSFAFARQAFIILKEPAKDITLQALKPTETLGNYMKVALLCGIILAMPVIVYQIGRFIAPGLTKKEKRYLFLLVPGATFCFVAGVAFAYFVMMPPALKALGNFLNDIIQQQWAVGEYLSFVTSLLFWIGVSFELPLFVYFLAKIGLIDAKTLTKNRKYAIVVIAILAAVITPTVDPFNMALVMGPLVILYEIGVLLAKIA
jgi:sec-independent protein translocase protein TatC